MKFEPSIVDLRTRDMTGQISGVLLGTTLWMASFEIICLTDDQSIDVAAVIRSLKGSVGSMLFIDPMRRFPRSYRYVGMSGLTTQATSWSVDADRDTLTLNGLSNGIVLQRGDLIGFIDSTGDKATAVELMEGGTTAAGTIALDVFPSVPAVVDGWASPVAYLESPKVTMRLTAETSLSETSPEGFASHRLVATQYLPE